MHEGLADGVLFSAAPWENYQLPEFPWPLQLREAYPTAIFPPAKAILEYIEVSHLTYKLDPVLASCLSVLFLVDMACCCLKYNRAIAAVYKTL